MRLRLARRLSLEQLEPREMLSVTFQGHLIVDQSGPRSGEGGSFFPAHVVLAADIDGDDDADVVVGNNDTIYWYENTEGSGDFGFGRAVVTTKSQLYSGSVADVDGDTDLDVICATSGEISWYENTDGKGTFGLRHVVSDAEHGVRSVHATDLDSDGDLDMLLAVGQSAVWYENMDGQGNFGVRRVISPFGSGWSVHAADFDSDGDVDVLSSGNCDDCEGEIAWHENYDGRGSFQKRQVVDTAEGETYVTAADIDNDNDLDVLLAAEEEGRLVWYENVDREGSFVPHRVDVAEEPASAVAADLDSDGDLDIVASLMFDGLDWNQNTDGNGHFGPASIINSTDGEKLAQTIDLDGDGDVDILSAYHTLSAETEYFRITWWENVSLQPGDSDQDLDFDERDIEQILKSGKYLTDEPTTWAEGDWNADGVFNQEDIVAALATGNYLQGPYAAESSSIVKPTQDTVDDLFAVLP